MKKIDSIDEYKELLHWNKGRLAKVQKNCMLMSSAMNRFIEKEKLSVQIFEDGLVFYIDEGRYYNLYYFWESGKDLGDLRQDKPVLIEELDNGGSGNTNYEKFEPQLKKAGFDLFKNNLQLELAFPENVKLQTERAEAEGFSIGRCRESDRPLVIRLWQIYLDATDIPEDHLLLGKAENLFCVYDKSGTVAAAYWWKYSGKTSEGRHMVTHPDHYRKGLASALLSVWCNEAAKEGITRCQTWVSDQNIRSLALYQKMGFVPNGKISRQYILR